MEIHLSHFSIVLGGVYWWYHPPASGIALPSLVSPSRRWYRPPTLETIKLQALGVCPNSLLTF